MIDIHAVARIAVEAGQLIMGYYHQPVDVMRKTDDSPVTEADIVANNYIAEKLLALTPDVPVVAEENSEAVNALGMNASVFWLVDPLDGTKGFIRKSGEFTVNIGLIREGKPVAGVIYVPVTQELYYAGEGSGSYKQQGTGLAAPISVRHAPEEGMIVVASHSHRTKETDDYINTLKVQSLVSAASSLKFCLVAEGKADIYPRFGRTMEWDTAAGHAILQAAGGRVERLDGSTLRYGKQGFENPYFIAKGFPCFLHNAEAQK